MPVKKVGVASSFQQRTAIKRILNQRGLGIVRRVDENQTRRQIIRRLQQREAQQLASIGLTATPQLTQGDIEESEAISRLIIGKATYNDYRKTSQYRELLKEYGTDIGDDIAQAYYADYMLSKGGLSQKEIRELNQTRATAISLARRKLKIIETTKALKAPGMPSGPGIESTFSFKSGAKASFSKGKYGPSFSLSVPRSRQFSLSQMLLLRDSRRNPNVSNVLSSYPGFFESFGKKGKK